MKSFFRTHGICNTNDISEDNVKKTAFVTTLFLISTVNFVYILNLKKKVPAKGDVNVCNLERPKSD